MPAFRLWWQDVRARGLGPVPQQRADYTGFNGHGRVVPAHGHGLRVIGRREVPCRVHLEECSLDELQAFLEDIGAELRAALIEMLKQGKRFGPMIGQDLKNLMREGVSSPVSTLLDPKNMNCRLFAHAWDNFSGGMCYEVIGAITRQTFIVILEGILSLVLMFLMFGLWRYFIDNRVAWKQQQSEAFHSIARRASVSTADLKSLQDSVLSL
jgi:hypothetical protein